MAVSDHVGRYGGTQTGPARLVVDPETGEQQVVYDEVEVSPNSRHTPWTTIIRQQAPRFAVPFIAAGGDMLMNPVTNLASGAATGSVPGATGLPTGLAPAPSAFTPATMAGAPTAAPAALAAPTAAPLASQALPPSATPPFVPPGGQPSSIPWGAIIPGAIEAGVGLWTANRASNAAQQAAQTQTQAGERAMALNREALGPYMNMGGQAANTLAGLSGFTPMPATAPGPQMGGSSLGTIGPRSRPPDAPIIGRAKPRGDTNESRMLGRTLSELRPVAAQAQTQSGYVRLQDDTGQEMSVPAALAPELVRRGARRVS